MKSIFLTLILLLTFQASAEDCPVQFGDENYLEKVGQAIQATESCYEASTIAEACALGASGDAYSVPVATEKCEQDFTSKLTNKEKATYEGLGDKCTAKYENMAGTMYISFHAFCRLQVARLYSELYTPAE